MGSDAECILRNLYASISGGLSLTKQEMTARIAIIPTKDIWNVKPTNEKPLRLSHKTDDAVDVLQIDRNDQFISDSDYLRLQRVETQ